MTTRLSIDLDDELYRRLKVHCALEKQRAVNVVRKLLQEYLAKVEKKQKK